MTYRNSTLALLVLAAGLAGCDQLSDGGNALPHMYNGDQAMKGARYEYAASEYAIALKDNPGNPVNSNALGRALMALNRPADAVEYLRTAVNQEPQNAQYTDDLCDALVKAGRTEEMFRLLRGNADNRGGTDDWLRLGAWAMRVGDPDVSKTALMTAARVDKGTHVAPQFALHKLYSSLGDRGNAEMRLRTAYYVDPHDSDVIARMKTLKVVSGPTFPLRPPEMDIEPTIRPEPSQVGRPDSEMKSRPATTPNPKEVNPNAGG
ncbi:hypothetical protein BH11PLA1_BH11PLA1_10360 [soil metagenome]